MEIKRLLFIRAEKFQYLIHQFPYLWKQFKMRHRFLTNFHCVKFEDTLYFAIPIIIKIILDLFQTIKKLE